MLHYDISLGSKKLAHLNERTAEIWGTKISGDSPQSIFCFSASNHVLKYFLQFFK